MFQNFACQHHSGGFGHRNLVPVFTGIARTGHPAFNAFDLNGRDIHEAHVFQGRCQFRHDSFGRRALNSKQRAVFDVFDNDIRFKPVAQTGNISILAGRVHDQKQMIPAIGDHQVIFDPARVICEEAVTLTVFRQALHIHRHQRLKRLGGITAATDQNDLPHVADIKETGLFACMQVFFHHPQRIADRHIVSRELNDLCAQFDVQIIKRRALWPRFFNVTMVVMVVVMMFARTMRHATAANILCFKFLETIVVPVGHAAPRLFSRPGRVAHRIATCCSRAFTTRTLPVPGTPPLSLQQTKACIAPEIVIPSAGPR